MYNHRHRRAHNGTATTRHRARAAHMSGKVKTNRGKKTHRTTLKWKVRIADTKWVKTTSRRRPKKKKRKIQPRQTRGKLLYFQPQASTLWLSLPISCLSFVYLLKILRLSLDCWWNCFLPSSEHYQCPRTNNESKSGRAAVDEETWTICCIEYTTHLDSIQIDSLFVLRGCFITRSIHARHWLTIRSRRICIPRAFFLPEAHTHTDYTFMHNLFAYNRDTRITVEYCNPDKIYGRNAGEIDKRQ